MDQKDIDEILNHVKQKFDEEVPGIVKMVIRKKMISRFREYDAHTMPESMRNCSVENLIDIIQQGIESGKLRL
ncbi:hypothetical protein [Candidatus Nitrosopumilus sediminis]|uniref:Uncharacterized protein n=1 Tax=Candidatus Nitrosopumilus sediminis TaxID=1229909 RepID=K0B7Q6_9ARCH|nr:hypothetical protein [Candidatus Nitrosopumilus sediminis]AFS82178.1 hypothetical protein NSED_01830 [Candidatus Nitrosopumilus sediminis]